MKTDQLNKLGQRLGALEAQARVGGDTAVPEEMQECLARVKGIPYLFNPETRGITNPTAKQRAAQQAVMDEVRRVTSSWMKPQQGAAVPKPIPWSPKTPTGARKAVVNV
jgi:hypothetical protein